MSPPCKLNIILDIDETLLYFIKRCYFKHSWDKLEENQKNQYRIIDRPSGIFLIRPHLEEFLEWCFTNCNVYLWTWSDREYAEGIEKMIKCLSKELRNFKFTGIFADEDANASSKVHGNSKDLNHLWYTIKTKCMAECNTILIDDLPGNSINCSNRKNSITVNPFALFGEVKARTDPYTDVSKDETLLKVLAILKKVDNHMKGCYEDCDRRWTNVFNERNIKQMGITEHVKNIMLTHDILVKAIGVGPSIHFVSNTSPVQDGGRLYYKTEKKVKRKNVYVGRYGGKYVKKAGTFTKFD